MSEGKTPPASRLEARIDTALGDWPMPEKSAIDWDESADRIVDRIGNGERGHTASYVSDEDLLAAPLAMSTEEAQNSAAPGKTGGAEGSKMGVQSERRERRSFQGLAEMARGSTPPPSAASGIHRSSLSSSSPNEGAPVEIIESKHKGDSGVLDLNTLAAEDPGAAQRAQSTPLASSGLFDEDIAAAAVAAQAPTVAQSPSMAPIPVQAQAAKAEKKGGGGVVVFLGTVVAVAAIAAGTFFVIKTNKTSDATKLAAAPTATTTNAPAAKPQGPATPVATTDNAVDPNALPLANANAPTATAPTAAPTGLLPFAPRVDPNASAMAMAPAAPPAPTASAPEVASAVAPTPAPTGSANLEEQMRQAAGPSTSTAPAPTAADTANTTPANIPMKPSQGAVSGALSAALPSARQCLGPDDPISQASVTFQSNGSVVSVSISGGAAGKPQEACIRQALMKAKIAPFAQPTFIGYVTVRPN